MEYGLRFFTWRLKTPVQEFVKFIQIYENKCNKLQNTCINRTCVYRKPTILFSLSGWKLK